MYNKRQIHREESRKNKVIRTIAVILVILIGIVGCNVSSVVENGSKFDEELGTKQGELLQEIAESDTKVDHINLPDMTPVKIYDSIYTLDEILSMTFNGVTKEETLIPLLQLLDQHQVKATFFVSNKDISKYKNEIKHIVEKGHDIESYAYKGKKINELSVDELSNIIQENIIEIEKITGKAVKFLKRTSK